MAWEWQTFLLEDIHLRLVILSFEDAIWQMRMDAAFTDYHAVTDSLWTSLLQDLQLGLFKYENLALDTVGFRYMSGVNWSEFILDAL